MKQAVSQKQKNSLKWYDQVIPYSAQMHNNKAVGIKPACSCICAAVKGSAAALICKFAAQYNQMLRTNAAHQC